MLLKHTAQEHDLETEKATGNEYTSRLLKLRLKVRTMKSNAEEEEMAPLSQKFFVNENVNLWKRDKRCSNPHN